MRSAEATLRTVATVGHLTQGPAAYLRHPRRGTISLLTQSAHCRRVATVPASIATRQTQAALMATSATAPATTGVEEHRRAVQRSRAGDLPGQDAHSARRTWRS